MSLKISTFTTNYAHMGRSQTKPFTCRDIKIQNRVRSLAFLKINKPIPTTMFVKGNLVKLRHNGQDRTPFCTQCKTKGHYRLDCPELKNQLWTEPAMDWAQEMETNDAAHPQGGEQQFTVDTAHPQGGEQQSTVDTAHSQGGEQQQPVESNKKTTTSPGGKQQKSVNTETASKNAKPNTPQEKQQNQKENNTTSSQASNPDQEWREIKYKNKPVRRNRQSNTADLTQIMGEIFTPQEPSKYAIKRKNKTRVRPATKTLRTKVEYNKYTSDSESSIEASDERSSESSSEETTITESAEN